MAARLLFVFSKEPRPGSVKTRMSPPLDGEQAARCHTAFLRDLVARVKSATNSHVVLAATPDGDAPVLAALAREHGIELAPQGSGDLGARMATAFARARREAAAAVVIGSDSPDLPTSFIDDAFEAIAATKAAATSRRASVVLGPCDDGGYYLIGCGPESVPPLDGISWGSSAVLEQTLARAQEAQLSVRLLPRWYDVDDAAGLRRLATRLRTQRSLGETALPHTVRLLDELRDEGIDI